MRLMFILLILIIFLNVNGIKIQNLSEYFNVVCTKYLLTKHGNLDFMHVCIKFEEFNFLRCDYYRLNFTQMRIIWFVKTRPICCYVTITGQSVTSYSPKTNMIGKYVTQIKPVYVYDTIQKSQFECSNTIQDCNVKCNVQFELFECSALLNL